MNKNYLIEAQEKIQEILDIIDEIAGYIANDVEVEEYFREVYPEEMRYNEYELAIIEEISKYYKG